MDILFFRADLMITCSKIVSMQLINIYSQNEKSILYYNLIQSLIVNIKSSYAILFPN